MVSGIVEKAYSYSKTAAKDPTDLKNIFRFVYSLENFIIQASIYDRQIMA